MAYMGDPGGSTHNTHLDEVREREGLNTACQSYLAAQRGPLAYLRGHIWYVCVGVVCLFEAICDAPLGAETNKARVGEREARGRGAGCQLVWWRPEGSRRAKSRTWQWGGEGVGVPGSEALQRYHTPRPGRPNTAPGGAAAKLRCLDTRHARDFQAGQTAHLEVQQGAQRQWLRRGGHAQAQAQAPAVAVVMMAVVVGAAVCRGCRGVGGAEHLRWG